MTETRYIYLPETSVLKIEYQELRIRYKLYFFVSFSEQKLIAVENFTNHLVDIVDLKINTWNQ